ncbi:MAG: hypothetical protein ACREJO_03780 [Phycisphaerales bacterium]
MSRPLLFAIAAALFCIGGCAAPKPTEFEVLVPRGQYPESFAAAREVLHDEHWTIERADSRAGVITTRNTFTASLTGPADRQLSSTMSSPDDILNRQQRLIRMTWEPRDGDAPYDDIGAFDGPLLLRVRAIRLRVQDPGWRVPSTSVRYASRAIDPDLVARGMSPDYAVALNVDEELSAQLAAQIAARMNTGNPPSPPTDRTEPAQPAQTPAADESRP